MFGNVEWYLLLELRKHVRLVKRLESASHGKTSLH